MSRSLRSWVSFPSSQQALKKSLNSSFQPPYPWWHPQVYFLSILSPHNSKLKQLQEASSLIMSIYFPLWSSSPDCIGKWRDSHSKFSWITQWFPDFCGCSHPLFLSSHHALWPHPWIHAQDQPEELLGILVVHAYRLSEMLWRPQKNPLSWEVLQP